MKNDILQRVLLLLGLDKAKAFRNLDTANMAKFIALKYQLACSRGDTEKSPLHCAAAVAGVSIGGEELKTMKIPVVEGMAVCLDLVASTMVALILPATQSSGRVAAVFTSLCRHAMRVNGFDGMAALPFVLVEYNNRLTKFRYSVVRDCDAAQDESIYNAFLTALLTNEELDFDLEIEIASLRDRSRSNRQRLKAKMQSLGLKVLRGKKADVYLRRRGRKLSINIDLLAEKYPEAFAECCAERCGDEYITVKLHA